MLKILGSALMLPCLWWSIVTTPVTRYYIYLEIGRISFIWHLLSPTTKAPALVLSWCIFLFSVDWTTAVPGSLRLAEIKCTGCKKFKTTQQKLFFARADMNTPKHFAGCLSKKKSIISSVKINTENRLHVYYSVYRSTENCMRDRIIAWLLQLLLWLLVYFVSLLKKKFKKISFKACQDIFTSQCTGRYPCSNHDNLLQV